MHEKTGKNGHLSCTAFFRADKKWTVWGMEFCGCCMKKNGNE